MTRHSSWCGYPSEPCSVSCDAHKYADAYGNGRRAERGQADTQIVELKKTLKKYVHAYSVAIGFVKGRGHDKGCDINRSHPEVEPLCSCGLDETVCECESTLDRIVTPIRKGA